jgi:hypothetical protein
MPKPARGADLIAIAEGAPDFRRGSWWTIYKEARVFIPRGFPVAMAKLEINSIEHLLAVADRAAASIATNTKWHSQLGVRSHWQDCARPQLAHAAEERPMLLCKAAIAIECLQLYSDDNALGVDVYEVVSLVPACYRVEGWNMDLYNIERDKLGNTKVADEEGVLVDYTEFKTKALAAGHRRPDRILEDMAKGLHVTYELASLVVDVFGFYELYVESAKRPGRSGVAPASEHIVVS